MLPDALFTVFGRGVHMYGICIAVGIVLCLAVFYVYTRKRNMPSEAQDFTFFIAIAAIAVGFLFAKLYQTVYEWIDTGKFDFYGSGITVIGGLIGGAGAFLLLYFIIGKYYFKGKKAGLHKKEFNKVLNVAPVCITVAHGFGRIGCLMAGCCHGALLSADHYVFGGIWMKSDGVWGYYVPTQLYEALFLFVLATVLSVMYFKRVNLTMHVYLIAYGVWRIFIEFFRTDYRGAIFLGLAPSQWQSIVFIAAGIAMFIIYKVKKIPFVLPPDEKNEREENNGEAEINGQDGR